MTHAVVTKAALPNLEPHAGFALFRDLGRQLELQMAETETDFSVMTANGEIALQVKGSAIGLTLRAQNDVRLRALKQVVFARLARLDHLVVPDWDHVATGSLPPNLAVAHVAAFQPGVRLCCTNRLLTEVTLSPDGLIPRLQGRACRAR